MTDDALALAFRSGLPYVGLRDHEPDPDVDRIVPPEAAAAAGVVALAASADHVRFAVADPAVNLSSLAPYLGNRRVELAIAPRTELEAIVGAAPTPAAEPPVAGQETLLPVEAPAEPPAPAEPLDPGEPPAAAEPVIEEEPPAAAEEAPADEAPAEPPPRPTAAELLAAVATPGAEELLGATPAAQPQEEAPSPEAAAEAEPAAPEHEPEADAEPDAEPEAPPVERYKVHPEPADPGEDPSWLEPPSRLKRVLRVLLVIMLLVVIAGGALLAYLLTR